MQPKVVGRSSLMFCFCFCFSQLPTDKLDTAKKQVEYITPADTLQEEERRLRQASEQVAAQRKPSRPWFTANVVDHRYLLYTDNEEGLHLLHGCLIHLFLFYVKIDDLFILLGGRAGPPCFCSLSCVLTLPPHVPPRHAWCCLRDAGERAGMRRVLKQRPWGNPEDPHGGGKEAAGSDVLEVR